MNKVQRYVVIAWLILLFGLLLFPPIDYFTTTHGSGLYNVHTVYHHGRTLLFFLPVGRTSFNYPRLLIEGLLITIAMAAAFLLAQNIGNLSEVKNAFRKIKTGRFGRLLWWGVLIAAGVVVIVVVVIVFDLWHGG